VISLKEHNNRKDSSMKSRAKFVADFLSGVHVLWIFVVVGLSVASIAAPGFRWYAIGVVALSLLAHLSFGRCPLTILENNYRRQFDPGHNTEHGFTRAFLKRVFGISSWGMPTWGHKLLLAILLAVLVLWAR
jgi:hypothetical protein